jgi:hypothetical protein
MCVSFSTSFLFSFSCSLSKLHLLWLLQWSVSRTTTSCCLVVVRVVFVTSSVLILLMSSYEMLVSGRSPSSFRAGGGSSLGIREPIPGTSQQAVSPPTSRSFLGRFGIRKPSLLSLSSATSNVSVAAVSPHSYENRTFSLDDLLRPSRSMMSKFVNHLMSVLHTNIMCVTQRYVSFIMHSLSPQTTAHS